ncbi:diphosphomevalonate/mevalonate 3,5-bisphosphate decarboxylase family protein [Lutimonas sp.]|uniref:diphosphomevalonate/mevalonate 3,5-bisphosphate decarboxylase family protein n=1 Tax=Lutimonas sp. TaxID=1872403 RepID=UPI003D9B983E
MIEKNFIFHMPVSKKALSGSVAWRSPSNIALIKYWGKTDPQIPKNASISFTLSNCHSNTRLDFSPKATPSDQYDFQVFLDGKKAPDFEPKIAAFFKRVDTYLPFLKTYSFDIKTENSFPHSSGIASSASGMSALSLCLMSLQKLIDPSISEEDFFKKASFLARLGSGSAARSLTGPLVVWGEHPDIHGSSDLYGTAFTNLVHANFRDYQDTILLVDKGVKQVSSTIGHKLMLGHPFAKARFEQAQNNLSRMVEILKSGNLEDFIDVVEKEALSLHAMMMTSDPYFVLMKPNTLEIIEKIWAFRRSSGSHICFTLDAGANVHVLYPLKDKDLVEAFIASDLAPFCENNQFIQDQVGMGASQL